MPSYDDPDKQWAKAYLLDPLTAPEPSQETGPGSSFINPDPLLRTFSQRNKKGKSPATTNTAEKNLPSPPIGRLIESSDTDPERATYPTPPASASSTSSFHPSNPYHPNHRRYGSLPPTSEDGSTLAYRSHGRRSNSVRSPISPYPSSPPPSGGLGRSFSFRRGQAAEEQISVSSVGVQRSRSVNYSRSNTVSSGLRRNGSLSQRYPGDMSHRPLDIIKREQRAADRAPHLRTPQRAPPVDVVDSLDTIGGTYHHAGPYEATLATRNRNPHYAPLAAVRDSNREALKATPRENIQDSLQKHVPLQGTAVIAPGERDMSGKVMNYREGTDLMREANAEGGPYKRWDVVDYHPDDLKGKGEPSYTFDKAAKEKKRQDLAAGSGAGEMAYEMQSGVNGQPRKEGRFMVRQRSVSNAADGEGSSSARAGPSSGGPSMGLSNSTDLRRNNTTGKKLSEGLKRRFGSFRRKKGVEAEA